MCGRYLPSVRSNLTLSTYKPNMRDPRVRRRVQKVLDYCKGMVEFDVEGRVINSLELRKLFGNYSNGAKHRNELAIWLRANLLQEMPWPYFKQTATTDGMSKGYKVDAEGYAKVKRRLDAC